MADVVAEIIIARRKPENRQALADLIDGSATVSEIAFRLNKTVSAVLKMRRRFEKSCKRMMPRYETRGRKPKPIAVESTIAA